MFAFEGCCRYDVKDQDSENLTPTLGAAMEAATSESKQQDYATVGHNDDANTSPFDADWNTFEETEEDAQLAAMRSLPSLLSAKSTGPDLKPAKQPQVADSAPSSELPDFRDFKPALRPSTASPDLHLAPVVQDSDDARMSHMSSTASLMHATETQQTVISRTATLEKATRRRCSVLAHCGTVDLQNEEATAEILLQQAKEMDMEDAQVENSVNPRSKAPLIALVSHDNMKPLMVTFIKEYKDMLSEFRLTGTETTCKTLRGVGLEPEDMHVVSGPLGGDQALGYFITTGEIRGLFFFRDPLSAHAHAADIEALSRLADVYQIYFASNYRSSASLLTEMHENYMHAKQGRHLGSVRVPEGMSTDLGKHVTENYKATRAGVVANALK